MIFFFFQNQYLERSEIPFLTEILTPFYSKKRSVGKIYQAEGAAALSASHPITPFCISLRIWVSNRATSMRELVVGIIGTCIRREQAGVVNKRQIDALE